MLNFARTSSTPTTDRIERSDDPPEQREAAVMTMRELWESDDDKARAIFLTAIDGYEYEIWDLMTKRPEWAALCVVDRMDRAAERIQR